MAFTNPATSYNAVVNVESGTVKGRIGIETAGSNDVVTSWLYATTRMS